ncbi:MAG: bifunctional hydroxymethylpyrimidine kinase/phosphomethylpyrimidine kinase [Ruthenibacterium lactatiformans]
MQKQHTVLCIQDLSCVGRCSLAVVLPALAAMGVQPCALPTALLSTHTGGLGRPARTDESGFISAALAHYAQLGLAFDCVYSGYLAGAAQVALVEQAFRQAPAALKLVDPVMADHGRPYASMTPEIRAAVAQLCGQADVIVPNATEAALLLEELPGPAADGTRAARHASLLLQRFPALRCAVVTGGALSDGQRGNVCAVRGRAPVFLPYSPSPKIIPARAICLPPCSPAAAARLFRSRRHPSRRAFCGAGG